MVMLMMMFMLSDKSRFVSDFLMIRYVTCRTDGRIKIDKTECLCLHCWTGAADGEEVFVWGRSLRIRGIYTQK